MPSCDHRLPNLCNQPPSPINHSDDPSKFTKMASQQPSQEPVNQTDPTQNPEQTAEEETGYAPLVDPRLPTRKDTSLREFLSKIDDYAPIVRFLPSHTPKPKQKTIPSFPLFPFAPNSHAPSFSLPQSMRPLFPHL